MSKLKKRLIITLFDHQAASLLAGLLAAPGSARGVNLLGGVTR